MLNKAMIPLYINAEMLNNLFTVVIQEFAEIKSISTKDVVTIHLKSPMSEFSYDLFGKYIQGDLELAFQNEFTKQRTEEKISTVIVIFKKLRDILSAQGLLKEIDSLNDLRSIQENDYIEFTTQLKPNPVLRKVKSIVEGYEVENMFGTEQRDEKKEIYVNDQAIPFLRQSLNECRNERCQRFIAHPAAHSSSVFIVPIKKCCMLDYEDYLLSGNVSVMGKVIKKYNISNDLEAAATTDSKDAYTSNLKRQLYSHTMLDNIDLDRVIQKISLRFPDISSRVVSDDINVINLDNMIEVLPISIAI